MLFRGRSFSFSAFSLFIAFVMIFSTISWSMCLESRAAETNVINDANKDNQITLDEVDPAQLATYGLVTGYGVTGSDVTGSITSSSAYTTALSEIAGSENTIIVGTVVDGRVTFGEWFKNLCTNVYAELTDASVIKYTVYPSLSSDDVLSKLSELASSNVNYSNMYNCYNANLSDGDLFAYSDRYYLLYDMEITGYNISDIAAFVGTLGSGYLSYCYFDSSGNLQTTGFVGCWAGKHKNHGTIASFSASQKEQPYLARYTGIGIVGYPLVMFDSSASALKYLSMQSPIYCSSSSSCDCNARNDSLSTLNAYDWSALSSQVYTHVSSAVTDANATMVSQVQSIIDDEMSDLTEFIEEKEDSGSEEGDSDGSGSNSDLSDKLEHGNQLQQESNELQQENNELQKEENETSKGILGKLTDFFGSFFDNLIDSVVGLFVPSSDELKALFDRLNQFFSDTFGFLYYPFDFLIQAFDIFLSSDSSTGLTFPGFSIMGYEVWADYTYDIASDPVAGTIFEYVRIGTGAILSIFFVGYLRAFFDKRFGGGGS